MTNLEIIYLVNCPFLSYNLFLLWRSSIIPFLPLKQCEMFLYRTDNIFFHSGTYFFSAYNSDLSWQTIHLFRPGTLRCVRVFLPWEQEDWFPFSTRVQNTLNLLQRFFRVWHRDLIEWCTTNSTSSSNTTILRTALS